MMARPRVAPLAKPLSCIGSSSSTHLLILVLTVLLLVSLWRLADCALADLLVPIKPEQKAALLKIKAAWGSGFSEGPIGSTWQADKGCTTQLYWPGDSMGSDPFWKGVRCDGDGNVYQIYLDGSKTTKGGLNLLLLPSELGAFPLLDSLAIKNANVGGVTPASFKNLTSVTELDLKGNRLTGLGPLPASLYRVYLAGNKIAALPVGGAASYWRGGPKEVRELDLSGNRLTGQFPTAFSGLSALWWLNLASNKLSGPIPSNIAKIVSKLVILELQGNKFSGPLPSAFSELNDLARCDLSGNELTALPKEMPPGLTWFTADDNKIKGAIPLGAFAKNHLIHLSLARNKLTGGIPANIGTALQIPPESEEEPYCLTLVLNGNSGLGGSLPKDLGRDGWNICSLELKGCGITGNIPDELFTNIAKHPEKSLLLILDLGNNKLSGTLPGTMGQVNYPAVLRVNNNQLAGDVSGVPFPKELWELDLHGNQFFGRLPKLPVLPTVSSPDDENNALLWAFKADFSDNFFSGSPVIDFDGQGVCPIGKDSFADGLILNVSKNCLTPQQGCSIRDQKASSICSKKRKLLR